MDTLSPRAQEGNSHYVVIPPTRYEIHWRIMAHVLFDVVPVWVLH